LARIGWRYDQHVSSQVSGSSPEARNAELIVIGAGLIGLSCAWRAAEAGLDVLVVDAGPEERASDVAAGMIAPVGEASWGEEALLGAALASAEEWPAFASELERAAGAEVPYRRCGAVHVGLDRDELAELRRLHLLHEELDLASEWLPAGACRQLEPGLATDVVGGFEAPGEAEVGPRPVLEALRLAARAAGVRVSTGTVERLLVGAAGEVTGVSGEGVEEIAAERVLLAAGARIAELAPSGLSIPVRPMKGEIIRLRARPGERPCERIVSTERVYIVPRAGDEVVVGATVEDRGFDLRVTAGGVHELLREAYRALPEIAELELVECQAGLRPTTPDNVPIVGASGVEGLLIAGGHHRNGVLLAPITASAIVAELKGEEVLAEIVALSPQRFASTAEAHA
jgi:glycine oxidase